MIKAIVFDFDGLILDTESCEYDVLQKIYKEHGAELPLEVWGECIGTHSNYFDAHEYLEKQIGKNLDRDTIKQQRLDIFQELIKDKGPMPGVVEYLEAAEKLGLKIGLASSSSYKWVSNHLKNLGIFDYFECIKTSDDVEKVKPDPTLFQEAVKCLGVKPEEAVAFEDSANGAKAAKKAGLHTVIIPNMVTRHLTFEEYDLRLESLAELKLNEMIEQFSNGR
ncbi:HAD family hydrolase [Pseudalkalibacillus salsuginis]|uniref:HAD family hydrolase n=1 Tax=Pseudalkalibacillus salsuginis TaxID=2910972 RepID=UPI001F36BF60|nr:HAD-IA family hydrolase [Pseudalkalibacillus salsuginis]MCF6410988.1 HAD-IA family hydrolase [Pseudalkalibacillus salsuginis]